MYTEQKEREIGGRREGITGWEFGRFTWRIKKQQIFQIKLGEK
jgi:hypothetical protein